MDTVPDPVLAPNSIEVLFRQEFGRLVRHLALVDGAEAAADAVQEAFIAADRQWSKVSRMADPTAWVRRVALNRQQRRPYWSSACWPHPWSATTTELTSWWSQDRIRPTRPLVTRTTTTLLVHRTTSRSPR